MPTYEYLCDACGEKFEKFQSMSAQRIKVCPACGKRKVRRLIGAGAGLIFKGSGFYITDYRSENYAKDAKSASGEGKSEAKSDAKSDSKPESKGDSKSDAKSDSKAPAKSDSKPTESKPASESKSSKKSDAPPKSKPK